jgi:hypothetical protein
LVVAVCTAACGGGGVGGGGDGFMAATVDGVTWRAIGAGSVLTIDGGAPTLTVLGYTPIGGSNKQADRDKPQLEIVFTGGEPGPGTYDIAATPSLTVMYMPERTSIYGADSGEVRIAHIDSNRIDGSFAFVATLAPSGPDTVTVTGGEFSVRLGR